MKKILVDSLPENEYITHPVFLDEKYIILSPEMPVSRELKERLRQWDFTSVYSDGTQASALVLENQEGGTQKSPATIESSIKEKELQDSAIRFHLELCKRVSDIFERFKLKSEIKIGEITEIIKAMISEIKVNKDNLLHQHNICEEVDYVVNHSVRTSILSLCLSDFLKFPPHKQIDIGMAALLHRVGMLKIPPQIYTSTKPLSPQERKLILALPVMSYRILQENNFPLPVCLAVLEHQERIDGSGYPRHISGDKISLYGKIISVASSYTAAVSKRPFKTELDGHSGLMDLLKDIGKRYDDRILRSLVFTLSIYPLGTYVTLSNGTQGVVVKTNPENPKYPVVKLLLTEERNAFIDKPVLHTSEGDVVQIVRPLTQPEIKILKEKTG